ncbi:MAG: energy transducer TonB [Methylococcales bacterium]|jgi:protein TonB
MENTATYAHFAFLTNKKNSLLIALFVAAIVHITLVMGIKFSTKQPEKINKSIDITLVNSVITDIPEKPDFLAQENQLGAGEVAKKQEAPAQNVSSSSKQIAQEQPLKKIVPEKSKPSEKSKPKVVPKIITQQKSKKTVVTSSKVAETSEAEKKPQLTAESLQQQLKQLGTEIRESQASADQSKIKFVDSVKAHKYVAAQYMKDWESKVERTGNLNYPEVATKKNFSGTLTMDVGINADGSIYSIRINKSSGNPELDEAAKKIVRMSAPFPPLPLDLRKELDVLVITRVWKFSDESGLVTR